MVARRYIYFPFFVVTLTIYQKEQWESDLF